jgi:hypothetical protein
VCTCIYTASEWEIYIPNILLFYSYSFYIYYFTIFSAQPGVFYNQQPAQQPAGNNMVANPAVGVPQNGW